MAAYEDYDDNVSDDGYMFMDCGHNDCWKAGCDYNQCLECPESLERYDYCEPVCDHVTCPRHECVKQCNHTLCYEQGETCLIPTQTWTAALCIQKFGVELPPEISNILLDKMNEACKLSEFLEADDDPHGIKQLERSIKLLSLPFEEFYQRFPNGFRSHYMTDHNEGERADELSRLKDQLARKTKSQGSGLSWW